MHRVSEAIRDELKFRGTPEGVAKSRRYFKEPIVTYGCSVPAVKSITRTFEPLLRKDLDETLLVSRDLIEGGVMDEQFAAIMLLSRIHRKLKLEHFEILDAWIDNLSNWASIDGFTTSVVSEIVKRFPSLSERLLSWADSPNRWRRRASAVSIVPIARRGEMLETVFKIAEKLMEDKDEMVQKGVGWMLKEASKKHPGEIRDFLLKRRDKTSALTLRYASEKLPKDMKVLKSVV